MKKGIFTLVNSEELLPGYRRLTLAGDTGPLRPGQFAEVSVPGYFLRRPFSVADNGEGWLRIAVRVAGAGTAALNALAPGAELDVLCGLGNGFDLSSAGSRALLVGGGSGIPALYTACRELIASGVEVRAALGFNTAAQAIYTEKFAALGADVEVYTADGSLGRSGFVTAALADFEYTSVYACGPVPMLRRVDELALSPAQFSLEARMGCGFGACMGCTVETVAGPKRVCKDGPVFRSGELVWSSVAGA
ncbi:MAG TPA: dihydroorotate dehydrogenase electron transfer subunit [Candidatus Scatomorpha stercorigallinarum]|nr:dihydroorotate dehydrogenase electron transfer subunit [Candidatus Scatomorpha stercorigallinarum]